MLQQALHAGLHEAPVLDANEGEKRFSDHARITPPVFLSEDIDVFTALPREGVWPLPTSMNSWLVKKTPCTCSDLSGGTWMVL